MAAKKPKSLDLSEPLLAKTFGLQRIYKPTPLLSEWIAARGELNEAEMSLFSKVQENFLKNIDSWNDSEVKMGFISILIHLADFDEPLNTYYKREVSETVEGTYLACQGDMMLATGIMSLIKTPYFFLHFYKREKKYSGDPVGQMLGGMLIGQAKNGNKKPVYGCYVQDRYWFFCILDGKKYSISKSFDASENAEGKKIIFILRKLKTIIVKSEE